MNSREGEIDVNRRPVAMVFMAIILLVLLAAKSLWFDPVGSLDENREKFKYYALERAIYEHDSFLAKANLLTYRVTFVIQEEVEGSNRVVYPDLRTGEWVEEVLEGQYRAKVRGYLFYILPIRDIQVRGGI